MLLLLDTHVIVAIAREESHTLPRSIRDTLADQENSLLATTGSLWEIAIKHRLGKLSSPCDLPRWPALLSALAVALMDIDPAHVLAEADPVPTTRDPFDRLLLAICQVENVRLLTADRSLVSHPLAWKPSTA